MVQHWKILIFYLFKYRFVRAASARWHLRNFLSLLNFCVVVVDSIQSRRNWKSTFGLLCAWCALCSRMRKKIIIVEDKCLGRTLLALPFMMDDGTRRNRSQAKDFVWEEEKKENQFPGCFMASPKEDTRHKQEERKKLKSFSSCHDEFLLPVSMILKKHGKFETEEEKRRRESLKVSMLSLLGNNLSWYRLVVAVVSLKLETFFSSSRTYRGENDYTLNIFGEKRGWISETEIVSEKFL